MSGLETSILLLVLLGACLVALVLVILARREAGGVRADARADAQEVRAELREQATELARRRASVEAEEKRLHEQAVDLETKSRAISKRDAKFGERKEKLAAQIRAHHEQADADTASIAGMTLAEAQERQRDQIIEAAQRDAAETSFKIDKAMRARADELARKILATALNRIAVPTSAQNTVTIVPLPSQDLKGPLIGKEGRNIRTFEAVTGVNMLIDESPDHILLSGFDTERREVAQTVLEHLMSSGRINPERIEKAHAQAVADAQAATMRSGHQAAQDAGVTGLHTDLIEVLGRLRLRSSWGQNVQAHLVESAQIAGVIAAEIGADEQVARRAALLHDIGKAHTATQPGTHAALGAMLARRCAESPVVVNAIAAHHDEVEAESVEAIIVQIADSISAARPGARRDDVEKYVERMESLESMVAAYAGVSKVLAMAAGREIRVLVEPSEVSDEQVQALADAIAKHISTEIDVPGEVHVTVVRELRAIASTS